jgi:hypothetical protein
MPTTRPARTAQPAPAPEGSQRDRCTRTVRTDDDDIDAHIKEVADSLPPLTDRQRDILGDLLRARC